VMLNGSSTAGLRLKRSGRHQAYARLPVARQLRRAARLARGHRNPA
jgi:hypothetical protein